MFQIFEYFFRSPNQRVSNLFLFQIVECKEIVFSKLYENKWKFEIFQFFLARFGRCFKFIFVSNFREFLDWSYLKIWNVSNCLFSNWMKKSEIWNVSIFFLGASDDVSNLYLFQILENSWMSHIWKFEMFQIVFFQTEWKNRKFEMF